MNENIPNLPHVRSRNSIFDTRKDGCWLYRWFHIHSFILFIKSFFHAIKKEDTFNLSEEYWPENTDIEYSRWQYVFPFDSSSLIIFRIIKIEMIVACFLAFLDAGLGFAGPIIVKYILLYLNDTNPNNQGKYEAFALSGLWISFYFIKIFVREYWIRIAEMAATKVEVLLEGLIYKKIMKLSATYRRYINAGQFFTYWTIDVGVITSCIASFPTIVGAPTTLVLAVIFVCIEIRATGLLLLLAIAIAIIIALLINWQMASIYTHKLFFYDNRMSENVHMCSNFKELKCLVWQKMLLYQNIRSRVPENNLNKIYYLLNQISLFISNFMPYFIILILMIVEFKLHPGTWSTTTVYTIISYISVISGPLVDFPSIIVKILQYSDVFDRIDNFLRADQIVRTKSFYVENGTILIDHPIFNIGTTSSINRIIVKQSLFSRKKKYQHAAMKTMPLQVRLYHTLEFMSDEQTKKFTTYLRCLNIPHKMTFKKGDRIALLSNKSGSGKTSFVRTFLGSLSLQSGVLQYGGKIGHAGPVNLFMDQTIRYNVLFGEPYDQERLKIAYKVSRLDRELEKFKNYDQTRVDQSPYVISKTQRNLICLARALYYDCDILLLDDFFHEFQLDEAAQIYGRIKEYFKRKVIIYTLEGLHFLAPTDKVIILENRVAVEFGTYAELKQNPKSTIHKFKTRDFQLLHYQNIIKNRKQKQNIVDQQKQDSGSLSPPSNAYSPIKQHFEGREVNLIEESQKLLTQEVPKPHMEPTPLPLRRPGPVQLKYYVMLFRNGGFIYLATFLLICIAVGLQTFNFWLIGNLSKSPFGLSYGSALVLYAVIQIANGISLFVYGVFLPRVVIRVSERISNDLNTVLFRTTLESLSNISAVQLMYHFGNDLQLFYVTIDSLSAVFSNLVALISTIVIMGIASYYIWIVAGIVLVYIVACYLAFRRAYQETFATGVLTKRFFFRVLQDYVDGIQSVQFYDKVEWFRARTFDGIYFFCAQYKTNLNYVNHSFNILSGFAVLAMTAGILFLAISYNRDSSNLIYVNVAVSAVPKLLTTVTNLFNSLSAMVKNINVVQKVPFQFFRGGFQQDFDKPAKSSNWPTNGRIELRNVTYERQQRSQPVLDNLSLTIESGEIVGVYGNRDNDIHILFYLLNGMIRPRTNDKRPAGQIFISNADIASFGQTYITQSVLQLDATPAAFTGTIRHNLDPFNIYQDEEIEEALRLVQFWAEFNELGERDQILLDPLYGTLSFHIDQRGQYLSTITLQKLNIARAVLRKPKILLLDRALTKLEPQIAQKFYVLIRHVMKGITVLHLTEYLHFLLRCDRLIGFKDGKIVEEGKPWQLALNPKTRLYKMIEHSTEPEIEPSTMSSQVQSNKQSSNPKKSMS